MKRIIYILIVGLCLVSCNSQKRLARKAAREAARTEQVTEEAAPQTPSAPSISPEQQEPETLSVSVPKLKLTIDYQQRRITTSGSLTWVRDSIAILSIQPLLGMELMRVEATPESVVVIDKMNRRYATKSSEEVAQMAGVDYSFARLQEVMLLVLHDSPAPYHLEEKITSPVIATIACDVPSVTYNTRVNAVPANLSNYQKTTITTILSGK